MRYFLASLALMTVTTVAAASTATEGGPPPAYKLPLPEVSAEVPYEDHAVRVLDSTMHYIEQGAGEAVVFLHGNPTSSYLWRNVLPFVAPRARAIAPDLIGMGRSGRPDIEYTFADHYRYLEAFITALDLDTVTLVGHDWGAALAFEYARRHPRKVRGVAFLEGVLPPAFPVPSFAAMGEERGNMFRAFKDPEQGPKLVIDQNMFVEKVLPAFVNRPLGPQEMAAYRAPYRDPANRRPLLAWPREVPIGGDPKSTADALTAIRDFMKTTPMPTLLLYASPGVLVPPQAVGWYEQHLRHLDTAFVGQGLHFLQEDQPEAIGRAVADWLRRSQG